MTLKLKRYNPKYTFDNIREVVLERSDEDLLRLMRWTNHTLPLTKGQRNWAAGYIAAQLVTNNRPCATHRKERVMSKESRAISLMKQAFKNDPELRDAYDEKVAVILYQQLGTPHGKRVGKQIIDRIFSP